MIRVKTCFVAEAVVTDAETGQVSAFNLVENFQAPRYPAMKQNLVHFSVWERAAADPAKVSGEFSVVLDADELHRQSFEIDFGRFMRTRSIIRLTGFEVPRPGTVAFRLAIPTHGTADWVISAELTAPPPVTRATAAANPKHWESTTVTLPTGAHGGPSR